MSWNFANPEVLVAHVEYIWDNPVKGEYPTDNEYLIYDAGQNITIELSATPPRYKLLDHRGNVLADQAGSSKFLNLGVLPTGSYRVLFSEPGVSIASFGESRGEMNVTVWNRPSYLVARPATRVFSQTFGYPAELWPCLGMSSLRFAIDDSVDPNNVGDMKMPQVIADDTTWRNRVSTVADDPYRTPLESIIHTRNGIGTYTNGVYAPRAGHQAGIAQIVNQFGTNRYWYECLNEPDIYPGAWDANEFYKELVDFHTAVKAANPNAKVLGPNPVNATSQLPWFRTLLELGGGNYLDGISFHNYSNVEGDLETARADIEKFLALLAEFGLQNKPLFMTEWGTFAATYGSFTPMRQLRKTMMAILMWEQYGLPKERFVLFYGNSHGFWDFPSFYQGDKSGLFSTMTAMRVLSDELYSKLFVSRYNFGDEDNDFLGSYYRNPSNNTGVAVFMAGERVGDPMTFQVQGASSLVKVDAMGKTSTISVVKNKITLNLIGEPTYIRLPSGVTLTPLPRVLGQNLALTGNIASSAASSGNLDALHVALNKTSSPYQVDTPLPITVTLTLGQPTTIDTVYIKGMMPWQIRGAILDATVEVFENGSWVQVGVIDNTYTWINHISSKWDAACFSETYFDERWSWIIDIGRQVRTTQVRMIVTNATHGGEVAEVDVLNSGNGQGNDDKILSLQGIAVYNAAQAKHPEVLRNG